MIVQQYAQFRAKHDGGIALELINEALELQEQEYQLLQTCSDEQYNKAYKNGSIDEIVIQCPHRHFERGSLPLKTWQKRIKQQKAIIKRLQS